MPCCKLASAVQQLPRVGAASHVVMARPCEAKPLHTLRPLIANSLQATHGAEGRTSHHSRFSPSAAPGCPSGTLLQPTSGAGIVELLLTEEINDCKLTTVNTIITLGQRLRHLREELDMSLRELAGKLKVSAAFLSDVELGRRHPSERVLAEIARLLSTSVEDLRKYDTRPAMETIRRKSNADPVFGLAFRKLAESDLSAEDLLRVAEQAVKYPRKKK